MAATGRDAVEEDDGAAAARELEAGRYAEDTPLRCGGTSASKMPGTIATSSVVNWNSSEGRGDPSGMVDPGCLSSLKNGCKHVYKLVLMLDHVKQYNC